MLQLKETDITILAIIKPVLQIINDDNFQITT